MKQVKGYAEIQKALGYGQELLIYGAYLVFAFQNIQYVIFWKI